MAKRKKNFEESTQLLELAEQKKPLYEWAQEAFKEGGGQVSKFLDFCKRNDKEVHEATDVVSYPKLLVLKERFEAWIRR